MSQSDSNAFRNAAAVLLFLVCMAAAFYFADNPQNSTYVTYATIALVALLSGGSRHIWPLISLIITMKLLQFPISYFLKSIDIALMYYLCSALIDLLQAFCIVHYHNDESLLRFCRAPNTRHVPQVYLMAVLLACSSLVSGALAIEYIFYLSDPSLFGEEGPWTYQHQKTIKQTLKILFDLCIWSLLLDPNRWKILQKIQNKFLAP